MIIDKALAKVFGTANERELKRLWPVVADINALEPAITALSDEQLRAKTAEFRERFANPYVAAERGYVDDVIEPSETRRVIGRALQTLIDKRERIQPRGHDNTPL